MEEKVLYKIHIEGYVQGVGFRWGAAREARLRDIKGTVRNLPDGSVYIEAEGIPRQLDSFVEWCKVGPRAGHVESVTIDKFEPVNYSEFQIES